MTDEQFKYPLINKDTMKYVRHHLKALARIVAEIEDTPVELIGDRRFGDINRTLELIIKSSYHCDYKNLWDYMHRHRKRSHEMAAMLGISRTYFSQLLNEKLKPSPALCGRLYELTGIPPHVFAPKYYRVGVLDTVNMTPTPELKPGAQVQ